MWQDWHGIGSIGPVMQEQINGRILQASSPVVAVRNSNLLGLSMSIVFVISMLVIARGSSSREDTRSRSSQLISRFNDEVERKSVSRMSATIDSCRAVPCSRSGAVIDGDQRE